MRIDNSYRFVMLLAVAAVFGSFLLPMAKAQEWTLTGNVLNGATCKPIANATVSSPFNGNASTTTLANGNYTMSLGFGAWNITVSKAGYTSITFNTPYGSSGSSFRFSTYLLAPGAVAVNCTANSHAVNSTVPTTVTAASTVPSTATTIQQTGQSNSGSSKGLLEVGAGIIVLIIIIVIAFFAMSGKKSGKQEKKEEKKA